MHSPRINHIIQQCTCAENGRSPEYDSDCTYCKGVSICVYCYELDPNTSERCKAFCAACQRHLKRGEPLAGLMDDRPIYCKSCWQNH
jgi:hypothetical protein